MLFYWKKSYVMDAKIFSKFGITVFSITFLFGFLTYRNLLDYYSTADRYFVEFKNGSKQAVKKISCKFPELDPWNSSIMNLIDHPKPLRCNQIQPYLTFIDAKGYLKFNETELLKLKRKNLTDIKCLYRTFDRAYGDKDNEIAYDAIMELTKPTKLSKDLVEIQCTGFDKLSKNLTKFYFDLLAHPTDIHNEQFARPTETRLSVLFMTIDSISYSMFRRHMPRTNEYLTNKMGMFMMKSK